MGDELGLSEDYTGEDVAPESLGTPVSLPVKQPTKQNEPITYDAYVAARKGDDPVQVYNDFVDKVIPNQLRSEGQSWAYIRGLQKNIRQSIPAPQPAPADEGVLSNAYSAVAGSLGNIRTQAKIATALETGNTNMLLEAVREQQQRKPSLPEQRFSKALGDEQGVGFLKNLPGAIAAEPQGAFDALLGTVVGFAPFIAGGAIGGLAGPLGAAGGMAAVGGQLALGQRAAQAVVQAAQKANVDINDETAFYNWAKNGGLEGIFGPAIKGALTEAAVMAITGKVAGMFTGRAEGLLAKMAPSEAATPEALTSLRAGVRNAQLGELATNVGGFTAASVAGDIAAGDTPSAREAIVSALILLPTSLFHLKGKTGEAKRLEAATEETQKGLKQPVQLTDEEKQKILEMPTKEMTDEEMESQLREEEKQPAQYPVEDALASVNVARDVIKEVQNEKAIEQVKAELEARQAESGVPPAESKAAEQPGEPAVAAPEATGVPATTGEAITGERGGPSADAAVLEGAVSRDTAQPVDESRPVLNQEGIDKGVAVEPGRSEPTGVVGAGGESIAAGPIISGGDATGEGRVGGIGEVIKAKPENDTKKVKEVIQKMNEEREQQAKDRGEEGSNLAETIRSKPGANVARLAKMFGPSLYGDPTNMASVSVKELVQNAFDGIKPLLQSGKLNEGRIDVQINPDNRTITITDNGSGMEPNILGTKFLEIAGTRKEGERSSGGLGVAKMQFLFGNEAIEVKTLRNGDLSVLRSTGQQLEEAMGDSSKAPDITVTRGVKHNEEFPEGHGTKVTVTVPETWVDPVSGETKKIKFSRYTDEYPVFKSPLLEPVKVTVNGNEQPIGLGFPKQDYTQFVTVKFPWGTADIYVEKAEYDFYGDNVHVLSNGLWQFDQKIPKNPSDPWSDPLPRNFYINVDSKAKPEDAGYPFALNRQSFSPMTKEGFDSILKYIGALYRTVDMSKDVKNFGDIYYLSVGADKNVRKSNQITLEPPKKPKENALTGIHEGDVVDVVDGKLVVRGRTIPELTPEQLKGQAIDMDEFKVDPKEIKPDSVMVHDNILVPEDVENNVAKLEEAYKKAQQKYYDTDEPNTYEEMKKAREAYYAAVDAAPEKPTLVPITEAARKQFGARFDEFTLGVGDVFRQLRNAVADIMGYDALRNEAVGISFDKEYRGVSTRIPFDASLLNIALPEKLDPTRAGLAYLGTMIHELAHHKVRSHNESFPAEMQRIMYELEAANPGKMQAAKKHLVGLVERYHDILLYLNKATNHEHSTSRGKRFQNSSYQTRDEGTPSNLAQSGAGGKREKGISSSAEKRIEPVGDNKLRAATRAAATGVGAERKLPHDAIVGKDEDSLRKSIAYRRDNGTYDYYKIDEAHPTGDPASIEEGLTHAQVTQKMQAEGHTPEFTIGPNVPPKNTTRSGLHGWKDGTRQFAAIAMKDENGKRTGEWRVTTGPDLADTSKDANGHYNSPRTTVQVDSFRDVTRMYGEGGYSPTQKVDEAKRRDAAQAANERPESTYQPPGKTAQAINRASGVNYLGKQQAFQAEQRGEPLPLSHRPDLMETRKNALIENQFHKLVRERIEPLKVMGRRIAKNFRKSGKQIESDLVDLAYVSRTTRKLASPLYDATPEAKKLVEAQRKEAQDRLDQLHPEYRKALEAYGRELKKFSNDMYDYRVKAELIPKELAEEIKNSSEFYVPIRQDTRSTVGKRAKGLANVSVDPIARMVNDWHRTIKENFENQVKQATYRLAEDENIKLPDGSKLFDLAPVVKYDFDPITGMLRETVDPLVNKGDAVVVMFDGKPYRMSVNEEHLLAGLKSVPASEKPELLQKTMRGFSMFNAVYGGLKTAASPVFALKNLRDIQTAFAMADPRVDRGEIGKGIFSPEIWRQAIAEAGAAFFGKDTMPEAKEQGGLISRRGRFGLEAEQENPHIRLTPNPLHRANEIRGNLLSFEHGRVSNLMTFFTKLSENLPRMAVYSAAMKSPKMWQSVGRANGTTGKAVEIALRKAASKQQLSMVERELIDHLQAEAASASKNATVNFEPKGYASGPLNALFVFANAKTQSARTLAENLGLTKVRGGNTIMERLKRGNPYTQSAAGAYFLGGLLFAMYGYKNDPDNYSRLSDYAKDEYATYKSGGVSVPLSQDLAIAWTLAQSLVDAKMNPRWADPTMRQTKAATRFVTQFIQNFWPGGTSMSDPVGGQQGTTTQYLGRLITPTTMQIAHDLSSNQNPFGSPIVTGLEQAQRKNLPIYEVNKEKVSLLARGATQVLHKAGVMDAAPQSAQYLIDQFVKQNVDFVHSVAPTWEFFNGIFGAPKKGPEGEDRPNSFERTFFQQASPMSYKTDLKELLDRESAIAHDAGLKSTPRLNTLKQGEKQVAEIFKGYEKLTPEQQGQRVLRATEAQKNTLKRYNESFQQP